ncbi:hypothetical protein RJ639_045617 [Escallonia herrerae]|uniref:RNase H type-1 domain-containing protein n=1 Tax=Escallonia herrerae TaxID=1293975 RepID=A0AA88W864_9ASTE|nr:hypothetical protein RJ639_045617 [Escallonia herrerae]
MAVAPPSTHHSHLDPDDLRLRLTSRSSYGRKYRSPDRRSLDDRFTERGRPSSVPKNETPGRLSLDITLQNDLPREKNSDTRYPRPSRRQNCLLIFECLNFRRNLILRCIQEDEHSNGPFPKNGCTVDGFSNHPVTAKGPFIIQRHIGTTNTQSVTSYSVNLSLQDEVPKEHGIGEVKGDQTTARQCYVTSCRSKNKEVLIIEDLREDTKMQRGEPVKDLVSIEVYPGEENKTVGIGSNLKEDTKLELVNLLRTYADIFAWTAADMLGIDPEIITHRLNVDPSKKPIKQKKRTFAPERQGKIEEELVVSTVPDPWNLYVGGSSALGSSGAILILISPEGFTIEYALRFGFQASNNETEYEALLAGIRLAHALKVDSLSVHSDSQLVVNYVLGDYEAREERMAQYLNLVKTSTVKFQKFTIRQIPWDQNTQADTLSRLASAKETDVRHPVYLEFLKDRSISSQAEIEIIEQEPYRMDMIITYLSTGELPSERHENPYTHCRKYMKGYVANILEGEHWCRKS